MHQRTWFERLFAIAAVTIVWIAILWTVTSLLLRHGFGFLNFNNIPIILLGSLMGSMLLYLMYHATRRARNSMFIKEESITS